MAQRDKQTRDGLETTDESGTQQFTGAKKLAQVSEKVRDHLANERTFLAWMRTGLATITFGFVVARFGILLRELDFKGHAIVIPAHYSTFFGVSLTVLGVVMMVVALLSFLNTRRAIDREEFYPHAWSAIVLAVLASAIGALLAIYLFFTG